MGQEQVTRRFCVIGDPIDHSLSPALHTTAYAALGVQDARYEKVRVPADGFEHALSTGLQAFTGISVTMPHKRSAFLAALAHDRASQDLGIANTLISLPTSPGAERRWAAFNTDVHGIAQSFRDAGVGDPASAAILGSGATALSALAAMHELGAEDVTLLARSAQKLVPLVEFADARGLTVRTGTLADAPRLLGADAVISALAEPGARALASVLEAAPSAPQRAGAFLDVLYHPLPTVLDGLVPADITMDGRAMLARQAMRQVELMLGVEQAPAEAMEAAVFAAVR